MNGADLGVRLGREKRKQVVCRFAFLDLPDGRPVGPDAGEAGEGAVLVEREPDVAALGLLNSSPLLTVAVELRPCGIGWAPWKSGLRLPT